MRQKESFKLCLDIRSKKTFPWLLYFNTLVASNVQLNLIHSQLLEGFKCEFQIKNIERIGSCSTLPDL
jgi:hypothetical protein